MLDEEQLFAILHIIVTNDIQKIHVGENLHPVLKELIGQGDWSILNTMCADYGLLINNPLENTYEITNAGRNKYYQLKKKKRSNKIARVAMWATLFASIVSATYAVLTYYVTNDTSKEILPIKGIKQEQPLKSQSQPLIPDTTKVHDSLLKKKR